MLKNGVYYSKCNGLVVVQIINCERSASAARVLGTLPEGYRPSSTVGGTSYGAVALATDGKVVSYARVKTNGQVLLNKGSTEAIMTGQIVFPA